MKYMASYVDMKETHQNNLKQEIRIIVLQSCTYF